MPYINMTKDFSEMRRTIPGLGLTKRQLVAFGVGVLCSIPFFVVSRLCIHLDVTEAVMVMAAAAFPIIFCLLYKKDGMYIEKHLRYWYETHFVRNTERPYITNNIYETVLRSQQLEKEVEQIVFRGKTEKEIAAIKASGKTSEVEIGKKKFVIPLSGPIDRATKKELEKAVKKAKITGKIPESAQDTIPYRIPYEDGIFESAQGYYTQTIAFEDITYQLLDNDPKNVLFERWCKIINYFDPDVHFQFNYANMEMDKKQYSKDFIIPMQQNDAYNRVRKEYSDMLVSQFSKGTNSLKKERYLTYGVYASDYKSARLRIMKINKQIEQYLKRLGSKTHILNGYERLELLFRIFHPATAEKLLWNFDMPVRTGLSSKDFIAPSSFSFKSGPELNATRYFRVGDRIGAVSYVKVFASDMEDRIINDILNIDSNVWVSIHADTIPRSTALALAKDNIAKVQGMIMNEQKNANQSGYDMYMLPPEMETFKDAGEKLYHSLQRKDEQLFNAVITVVQTAATRKELENNIFELNGVLSTYQCSLVRLDNRQEQGYMSALPLGNNTIEVKRTFTTTDMAIFIPFTTKELYSNGQYYGVNSLSNNVITVDRKKLVNPNGLVFGMPGFGKTFLIKREILDVFLKTTDDRMIIDPEGEVRQEVA